MVRVESGWIRIESLRRRVRWKYLSIEFPNSIPEIYSLIWRKFSLLFQWVAIFLSISILNCCLLIYTARQSCVDSRLYDLLNAFTDIFHSRQRRGEQKQDKLFIPEWDRWRRRAWHRIRLFAYFSFSVISFLAISLRRYDNFLLPSSSIFTRFLFHQLSIYALGEIQSQATLNKNGTLYHNLEFSPGINSAFLEG